MPRSRSAAAGHSWTAAPVVGDREARILELNDLTARGDRDRAVPGVLGHEFAERALLSFCAKEERATKSSTRTPRARGECTERGRHFRADDLLEYPAHYEKLPRQRQPGEDLQDGSEGEVLAGRLLHQSEGLSNQQRETAQVPARKRPMPRATFELRSLPVLPGSEV